MKKQELFEYIQKQRRSKSAIAFHFAVKDSYLTKLLNQLEIEGSIQKEVVGGEAFWKAVAVPKRIYSPRKSSTTQRQETSR